MGETVIGALLGRNQSFDEGGNLASTWQKISDQASYFVVNSPSAVHSSALALLVHADSTGGANPVTQFDYGGSDDLHRVWFPEVGSHAVTSTCWARAVDAQSSGQLRWRVDGDVQGNSSPLPYSATPQRFQASSSVSSSGGSGLLAGLDRVSAANSSAAVVMDDVLSMVDPIVLYPAWSAKTVQTIQRSRIRLQGGNLETALFGSHHRFVLPVQWVTAEQVNLLQWWWKQQLNLALTLDSSDDSSTFTCRLAAGEAPLIRAQAPYSALYQTNLSLVSLDQGSLVF